MIQAAYVEATCVINGVGLIKLMGRHSGYIALNASLTQGGTDFCLIPENPYELEGPNGLYQQIHDKIKQQGHAVIVVAEGAEDGLINEEERFTKAASKDGSGNVKLDDIGTTLFIIIFDIYFIIILALLSLTHRRLSHQIRVNGFIQIIEIIS